MEAPSTTGMHRIIEMQVHRHHARGVIIDDFHHFRLGIRHDGERVTGTESHALRVPYSLCPSAGDALTALIDAPLTRRVFDASAAINTRLQCTHQFDISALLMAAAARNEARTYHLFLTDPRDGVCNASLTRSDGFGMNWLIRDRIVTSPADHAGVHMDKGFTAWAAGLASEDIAEGALVLRRAHMVWRGRMMIEELNQRTTATARSSCYVMQPERNRQAIRIPTLLPEGRLPPEPNSDDLRWLAGE